MAGPYQRVIKILRTDIAVFIFFLFYGFILWGLTQEFRFGSSIINTADTGFYLWCFKWWTYAAGNRLDPFFTDLLFAPYGINLAWTTCVPLFSLFAVPASSVNGYVLVYNLILSLNLGLSGFLFYLTSRQLNISKPVSLLTSALFVLSPYIWAKNHGHLNLVFVVFVVGMLYTVVLRFKGKLSDKAFVAAVAVLMVSQFLVSVEVMFSAVFVGFLAAVTAMVVFREKTGTILRVSFFTLLAGLLSIAVLSPCLYRMLSDMPERSFNDPSVYGVDLASVIYPAPDKLLHLATADRMILKTSIGSNLSEQTGYLGIPLLAVILVYLVRSVITGRKEGIFLVMMFAVTFLLGLGVYIRFAGAEVLPGLFYPLSAMPLFEHMLPNRIFLYTDIFACLAVANYLNTVSPFRLFMISGMVFLSWIPDINQYRGEKIDSLIPDTGGMMFIKNNINKGENAIVFPSYEMDSPEPALFQIVSDYHFRLSQLVAGVYPKQIIRYTGFLSNPDFSDFYTLSDFVKYLHFCQVNWIVFHKSKNSKKHRLDSVQRQLDILPEKSYTERINLYRITPGTLKMLKSLSVKTAAETVKFYRQIADSYISIYGKNSSLNAANLINAGMIDKQKNPYDPNFTADGYWIGEVECDTGRRCFGIGLNINFIEEAQHIYRQFKDVSVNIMFPFPQKYSGQDFKIDDKIFMLIVFERKPEE